VEAQAVAVVQEVQGAVAVKEAAVEAEAMEVEVAVRR
jgi:hypothetical protein